MLAHLKVTTEASSDETESKQGVQTTLEMLGLMQEEAKELTDVLRVDKVSSLAGVSTSRMKRKMEEIDIEINRIQSLLIGFEVFRNYYHKQDKEELLHDGSSSIYNTFSVNRFNAPLLRKLTREASIPKSSVVTQPRSLFGEVSSIHKNDSNTISQIPSSESADTTKSVDVQSEDIASERESQTKDLSRSDPPDNPIPKQTQRHNEVRQLIPPKDTFDYDFLRALEGGGGFPGGNRHARDARADIPAVNAEIAHAGSIPRPRIEAHATNAAGGNGGEDPSSSSSDSEQNHHYNHHIPPRIPEDEDVPEIGTVNIPAQGGGDDDDGGSNVTSSSSSSSSF